MQADLTVSSIYRRLLTSVTPLLQYRLIGRYLIAGTNADVKNADCSWLRVHHFTIIVGSGSPQ